MKDIMEFMPFIISILFIAIFYSLAIFIVKRAFKEEDEVDKISFKETFDLVGLPILILYQGDKKFNFILDSGATHSAFNMYSIEGVKGTTKDNEGTAFGIDGTVHEVKHVEIPLFYNNKELIEEFQVIDLSQAFAAIKEENGVTLHGILGNSFLTKYRYVLDFDKMIAYQKM